ncbi:MAG: helix-turn-helix domain-containing protein [Clostridiaceae bacterium]|nr:helix-turn-helix domain-containing protein [Clostridiaceae bacterium]
MGVTTNDIARICQVSRTTVIRALNNQGRISKETKDRIVKTAEELGTGQIFWREDWLREKPCILVL